MSKTVLTEIKRHSPTLKTILEIENIIQKKKYFNSKTELYRTLKNKTQFGTFNTVLRYLESSNKIEFNKDGSIVWIFADSLQIKKLLKESKPFTRL
ncbi:MAG: hypothetical protein WB988_11310 [Candidatus Nitrosopolaris sp.]